MPAATIAKLAPGKISVAFLTSTLEELALAQAVLTLDFRDCQAADPRQRPAAVGDGHRNHDLVGARRVIDLYFHAVEMAAYERGILVPERNIEGRSRAAALFRRRDQGSTLAK